MNILVIMGSPRKGNTSSIIEEIKTEMKKVGEVEFSTINIRDLYLE